MPLQPSKQAGDRDQRPSGREPDDDDDPSHNLWVGNLPPDTVDSELMALFGKFGALDSVTTYAARNYAFVYFKHLDDAKRAKDTLQGSLVRGNAIKIEFARPVCSPSSCSLIRVYFYNLCTDRQTLGMASGLGPLWIVASFYRDISFYL